MCRFATIQNVTDDRQTTLDAKGDLTVGQKYIKKHKKTFKNKKTQKHVF